MSRQERLESHIRESHEMICEYENIIRTSPDRPEEGARARRTMEKLWSLIEEYLAEYRPLTGGNLPHDIAQIAARFPVEPSQEHEVSVEPGSDREPHEAHGQPRLDPESGKNPFHRFWRIPHNEPLACTISTLAHRWTGAYFRPMTGFGEQIGYAAIARSLASAGITREARPVFADRFMAENLEDASLILLGGDDKNRTTKVVLDRIRDTFPFAFDCKQRGINHLVCKYKGKTELKQENWIRYKPRLEPNGRLTRAIMRFFNPSNCIVATDYGIVARLRHPFRDGGKLYILAGAHTFGTAAAAQVVAREPMLAEIAKLGGKHYRDGNSFVALISATVDDLVPHVDRIEQFYMLDSDHKPIDAGIPGPIDL